MKVKLKEILDKTNRSVVLGMILEKYSSNYNLSFKTGKDQDVFSRAYDTLKSTLLKDFSDAMLVIEKEEEEGDSSYVVYGLEPDVDGKMRHWGLSYASIGLSGLPWRFLRKPCRCSQPMKL